MTISIPVYVALMTRNDHSRGTRECILNKTHCRFYEKIIFFKIAKIPTSDLKSLYLSSLFASLLTGPAGYSYWIVIVVSLTYCSPKLRI